ncbi:hypothetical protein Hdeb2414_s0012g00389141 [Helianthus debilis subsp. tardiflorus]
MTLSIFSKPHKSQSELYPLKMKHTCSQQTTAATYSFVSSHSPATGGVPVVFSNEQRTPLSNF